MKKIILSFSILFILTIGIIRFIKLSNDHKECNWKIEKKLDSNGNTVQPFPTEYFPAKNSTLFQIINSRKIPP